MAQVVLSHHSLPSLHHHPINFNYNLTNQPTDQPTHRREDHALRPSMAQVAARLEQLQWEHKQQEQQQQQGGKQEQGQEEEEACVACGQGCCTIC